MYWFAVGATLVGLIALVWGYRKNNRNVLAAAGLLLLLAGGAEEFVAGFQDGVSSSLSTAPEGSAGQA